MNAIDYAILVVLAVAVLGGVYKGFVVSVLRIGAYMLSLLTALIFYRPLSGFLSGNTGIITTMLYYTEGTEKIAEQEYVHRALSQIPANKISSLISEARFPPQIENILRGNIANEVFSPALRTLGDYFNHTLVNIFLSTLTFFFLFLAAFLIFSILLGIFDHVFTLPVLSSMDGLLGGCFGLVHGILLLFVLFLLVPPTLAIIPVDFVNEMFDESLIARFFLKTTFLSHVFRGVL